VGNHPNSHLIHYPNPIKCKRLPPPSMDCRKQWVPVDRQGAALEANRTGFPRHDDLRSAVFERRGIRCTSTPPRMMKLCVHHNCVAPPCRRARSRSTVRHFCSFIWFGWESSNSQRDFWQTVYYLDPLTANGHKVQILLQSGVGELISLR
jgi:hypothetical protein